MNCALILAGGSGIRMGDTGVPKQFIEVKGKPVIIHTAEKFYFHPLIAKIVIICKIEYINDMRNYVIKHGVSEKIEVIGVGGNTRQESSFKGLLALREILSPDDIILIHDAARPLINERVITENIEESIRHGASGTVTPAYDTIVKSRDGLFISEMPNRDELYAMQTPQSFRYGIILKAHEEAAKKGINNATDDCRLVLESGVPVYMVKGDEINFKITKKSDLEMFKILMF